MRIRKLSPVVISLLVLSTFCFSLTILPEDAKAATLYVGGGGPGNFTTIQSAIDNATPGDAIYVYGGTYNENVTVYKTLNITGEDRNATIVDGGGIGDVFNINADWVNVTGFTVVNSGSDINDSGVRLRYANYCTIASNKVSDNWNGIYLHDSDKNIIADNTLFNNIQGVSLELSDNSTIANNIVTRGGILLFDSNNATLINNTISLSDIGILLHHSNGAAISDSRIFNNLYGIMTDTSNDNTIEDNIMESMGWQGMRFESFSNSVIRNNTISDSWMGIHLKSSDNNIIQENVIFSNEYGGIVLYSSYNNNLTENTMIGNGVSVGGELLGHWNTHTIDTSNSVNGKPVIYWKNVTGGVVPPNAGQVILARCRDVIVKTQNVSDVSAGIQLGFSLNNTIFDNEISNNSISGIYLQSSNENTIADNEIQYNSYGVYLRSSSGNRVFHNNFEANAIQGYDTTRNNRWYEWYPSGGNYWSDYSGPDQFSGPDQNEPGSDGIGDWAYFASIGKAWDRYPLMSPSDLAHPLPPTVLAASLSGKDSENVTVSWSLSLDDEMGLKSVIRYEILRNMTFNRDGRGYQLIASLPKGTTEFIDSLAGEGDPDDYYYRVCAVDIDNSTACSRGQVAKFTRSLSEGLNLVSIPLIQSNESIETVLQTVHSDNAWSYDPISREWKSLIKSKPYGGGFEHVNHRMGFWVNVTQDSNLTVAGFVPETTQIQLRAGWNLVGFPSFNSTYTVADLKTDVSADRVERFYPFWPPYHLRALEDFEVLMAGYGYWVHTDSETTWTVNNT